jgi:NADH-quinone oxidoreductase subunit J
MQQIIFIILGLSTLGAALMVVSSQNLMRSALWLIVAFFGIAAIFILLHAEFLAVAQILIYVGAIAMLIIFAIMLTRGLMDPKQPRFNTQWGVVGGCAALLFVGLAAVILRNHWPVNIAAVPPDAIQQLGRDFVGPYVVPFEVASVLLVVAMIGAIIVARERE